MPDPADLLTSTALAAAAAVRAGEVTARELAEASLAAIEARNPELNAVIATDAEGALAAADAISPGDERPLAGVPIVMKDILTPVAGMPFTMGSNLMGDFRGPFDGVGTARLRGAGAVIVGISATPEFGAIPLTESDRYGITRNPWDTGRTPGGSSGGSGAAVAGGMVPIAHATDGGGSIRIPAACCGLVGLKPSRGRTSLAPAFAESMLVVQGSLTRTVADTAAVLDVLAGPATGDASWAPPPAEPFATSAQREPGRLRVGLVLTPPIEAPIDPAHEQAVRDAAELLAELGHEVVEVSPPWTADAIFDQFMTIWALNIGGGVAIAGLAAGVQPTEDLVEPICWAFYEKLRATSAHDAALAVAGIQGYARGVAMWMEQTCDVLLTPSLAQPPLPVGSIDLHAADPIAEFDAAAAFTPFTVAANIGGQPAISLPFAEAGGLPVGIQLMGQAPRDDVLLSLAAQIEAARPWADRIAPGTAAAA